MCLLMRSVADTHPKLDAWVRDGLPRLPDLEAQIDAVTRASGAPRADVAQAFRPESFSPIVGLVAGLDRRARAHPTTVLRFDVDEAVAARFEADPDDAGARHDLNAAFLLGIAERLKIPGRVVVAEEIETEVFGAVLTPPVPGDGAGITGRTFPGKPLAAADIAATASALDVEEAHVWTILVVEARACGFDQDRRPKILYERHVFSRLTGGVFDAHAISSPVRGGYDEGPQYERLRAAFRRTAAALRACSWGLGQVMGENHRLVGHDTVDGFVSAMIDGERAQLDAMRAFIASNGIDSALREQRWADFAKVYNGPAFRDNAYDTKLAAAFQEARSGNPPDIGLRRDQMHLTYLNLRPGPVDGRIGEKTRDALRRFQQAEGLPESGEPDAATSKRLAAAVARLVKQQRGNLL